MGFLQKELPTVGKRWRSPEFPYAIKLRNARIKAGYTIDFMCEKFELSKSEFMLIEYGDFAISLKKARAISIFLDVDIPFDSFNKKKKILQTT